MRGKKEEGKNKRKNGLEIEVCWPKKGKLEAKKDDLS